MAALTRVPPSRPVTAYTRGVDIRMSLLFVLLRKDTAGRRDAAGER